MVFSALLTPSSTSSSLTSSLLSPVSRSRRPSSATTSSSSTTTTSSAPATELITSGQTEINNRNGVASVLAAAAVDAAMSTTTVSASFTSAAPSKQPATPLMNPWKTRPGGDRGVTEYIADESHIVPPAPEPPDLRQLNASLEALAAIFPDIQIDVFREMLVGFDSESRLALVADALLKNCATWVKGRWRVAGKEEHAQREHHHHHQHGTLSTIPPSARFRTAEYKKAAQKLAWREFKGLPRSTINAVLAESNYCYLEARRALIALSSKSWRFAISSLFLRRKVAPATGAADKLPPLVVWKSLGGGGGGGSAQTPTVPCFKSTGNTELDTELFYELIVPLQEGKLQAQVEQDLALALRLNEQEAKDAESTHDCACCFSSAPFENLVSCSSEGHLICMRCVQHCIKEAVFGQAWQRTIDQATGTLRCPAVDATECPGRIARPHMQRAMARQETSSSLIMRQLDQRLAEHSLVATQLPLVRCPFCPYAEVDEAQLPFRASALRFRTDRLVLHLFLTSIASLAIIAFFFLPPLLPLVLVFLSVLLFLPDPLISSLITLLFPTPPLRDSLLLTHLYASITRCRLRRRGPKFHCRNPCCARPSCLSCGKAWRDIHICHESALVALRTHVEQAMSMAIKRVCPRCHTAFVKASGCNKLTCPCGYKMCYVCRADISAAIGPNAGYRHFCDHFRPDADPSTPCDQCDRCNLWETEDTDRVLRDARAEAERKWREVEKRELSLAERTYLETGVAVHKFISPSSGERGWGVMGMTWQWEKLLDLVVDMVLA